MALFRNEDHVYRVIGEFMKIPSRPRTREELKIWWGQHPAYEERGGEIELINRIGEQIRRSHTVIVFHLTEPEAVISLDAKRPKKGENYAIYVGHPFPSPDVVIKTTGDTAHQFWGGNVHVPLALLTGKMKAKGSKAKALQLLPHIVPAFPLYRRYLELIDEPALLKALKT
ncbi:SCP2 sterol-binding domain-containing protein [Geobacillus subterraneus]|uniref:SCP2 sterol-binding domain-containing protein n=1 Tax=Geobacillus subterraneus TaxID=129338 RepID=UPI001442D0F3|nr:SCP2 sterol-binding domain-containing protein [Geobacillus subterraneus]QIZ68676.1 SCP2 sterol-binding domain-containing protein [Geobacillus subterraneus]WPZ17700.1 SCP2 sterol-binding domain-containing protein [Geobacillus subterraneus]